MLQNFFLKKVKQNFPFTPTNNQSSALENIVAFLFDHEINKAFLLTGYAGTGKSSLLGALVKTMKELNQQVVLLAPTGRAAKVLSFYSNHPAFTIHKKIYRQKSFSGETAEFNIMDNLHKDTTFIVDEASMINNESFGATSFGTGRLLDDLIRYVYSGENCRLMLIGDDAQLPPVGLETSPALSEDHLIGYGLNIYHSTLLEVVRQTESSGILSNATSLRKALQESTVNLYPQLHFDNFVDIQHIKGEDLIDTLSSCYGKDGTDSTMVVTRSNKRANIYNQGIRNTILYREDELTSGDFLMITKNNYFWSETVEGLDFLANGEIVEVKRVRNLQELYGFRFCDVELKSLDHDIEFSAKIILDSLHADYAGLSREDQDKLFNEVMNDYTDLSTKSAKFKQLKTDPYFNALQVKFAYAITCHKAQGGEWMNVFVDIGYITEEQMDISFYRWLYTAITRATNKLYFVNLPKEFY